MYKEATILMDECRKLHDLLPLIERLTETCNTNMRLMGQNADLAFACREVKDMLEHFEKAINALYRLSQENVCLMMDATNTDKVQTEFCTATQNPKLWYTIPHKRSVNPDRFDEIMKAIGVGKVASELELVRFNAPALMDAITTLIGMGKPPFAGIDPEACTGVELNLRITRRR